MSYTQPFFWINCIVIDAAQNCPNSFWKQTERYFSFISDDHINFMKHQVIAFTSFSDLIVKDVTDIS